MTIDLGVIIPIIISIIAVVSSFIWGFLGNKRSDTHDIEQRVAERTETNCKLDEISRNVTDIKYDISSTKRDVQAITERLSSVESSTKSAHRRIDAIQGVSRDRENGD